MKFSLKKAMINFILAYIVVTILAYSLSILVGIILKLPSAQDLGVSMFEDPAFVKTVPYHLLINLLAWTFFSYRYFKKTKTGKHGLPAVFYVSCCWLITAIIVDFLGFVLIKSPVSLTPHQFYIEYQPWISITYAIVFISPFISYAFFKRRHILANG